jgi:methionine-rich copper-binding protein CopC
MTVSALGRGIDRSRAQPYNALLRRMLVGWGSILFLFGACQLLRPKARYIESDPRPGAILQSPPTTVTVTFSESLSSDSRIGIYPSVVFSPSGERSYGSGDLNIISGIDHDDSRGRTLRAVLGEGIASGRYRVRWSVIPAKGGPGRNGHFEFTTGAVPDDVTRGMEHELTERDTRWRGHRSAVLGGIILISMGLVVPLLPRQG